MKRNQFGSYAGGPVYIPKLYNGKNKTFFFMGWQATRLRNINNAKNANGPTVDELNGNFNTCGTPCTNVIKDANGVPYPGKIIPTSQFDPVALAFAKQLLPQGLTGTGNFTYQTPVSQNFAQGVIRGDHQIGQNDRLTLRYFIDNFTNAADLRSAQLREFSNGSETRTQREHRRDSHLQSDGVERSRILAIRGSFPSAARRLEFRRFRAWA